MSWFWGNAYAYAAMREIINRPLEEAPSNPVRHEYVPPDPPMHIYIPPRTMGRGSPVTK